MLPFLDKELWFYKYIDKVKQIKDKSELNIKNIKTFDWLNSKFWDCLAMTI